jgi:ribosomal protein S18 acetylase RimI-like enzyme
MGGFRRATAAMCWTDFLAVDWCVFTQHQTFQALLGMIMPLSVPLTFETFDTLAAEAAVIDAGLDAANAAAAPLNEVRPITCVARAPSGVVVAGALGRTWGDCAELQQLWVGEAHRRNGIGSRLVRLFEARAKARGCRTFYLETFSFQAPALYESLGYRRAAELRGFPGGIVKYLMVRTMGAEESAGPV